MPWTITLPSATITLDPSGELRTATGRLTRTEARRRVEAAYPTGPSLRGLRPHLALFQATVLVLMLGPVVAFAMAIASLSVFMHPAVGKWVELLSAVASALGVT